MIPEYVKEDPAVDEIMARKLSWNEVLVRTYSLYSQNFVTFLKIAFLPAVIAWLWRQGQHLAILQAGANGWLSPDSIKNVPLMAAMGLTEGAVYWIISAFFFAAVASQALCEREENVKPLTDAFSAARDRLGAVLGVALLTWVLLFVGRSISLIAIDKLLERSHLLSNLWVGTIIYSIPSLLIAGLVSRFGLAIPALMTEPEISVKQSLKKSMALTEGWEPYFMMFLVKSTVLAFAAAWAGNLLLDELWSRGLLTRPTFPWVQSLLYIGIVTVVETPLFVSFCVLYRDLQETAESALSAPAIG